MISIDLIKDNSWSMGWGLSWSNAFGHKKYKSSSLQFWGNNNQLVRREVFRLNGQLRMQRQWNER